MIQHELFVKYCSVDRHTISDKSVYSESIEELENHSYQQGGGNTMLNLSDQVPFNSGQVRNLYFLVLGQVYRKLIQLNTILYVYYELTSCVENSLDPDQLASEEAC